MFSTPWLHNRKPTRKNAELFERPQNLWGFRHRAGVYYFNVDAFENDHVYKPLVRMHYQIHLVLLSLLNCFVALFTCAHFLTCTVCLDRLEMRSPLPG